MHAQLLISKTSAKRVINSVYIALHFSATRLLSYFAKEQINSRRPVWLQAYLVFHRQNCRFGIHSPRPLYLFGFWVVLLSVLQCANCGSDCKRDSRI